MSIYGWRGADVRCRSQLCKSSPHCVTYKKAVEENFPCAPKDVCREWNWDINPAFEDNPRLLADFRKAFEPHWNPTVGEVRAGRLSNEGKFILAGYWAQLTTCTPGSSVGASRTRGRIDLGAGATKTVLVFGVA